MMHGMVATTHFSSGWWGLGWPVNVHDLSSRAPVLLPYIFFMSELVHTSSDVIRPATPQYFANAFA